MRSEAKSHIDHRVYSCSTDSTWKANMWYSKTDTYQGALSALTTVVMRRWLEPRKQENNEAVAGVAWRRIVCPSLSVRQFVVCSMHVLRLLNCSAHLTSTINRIKFHMRPQPCSLEVRPPLRSHRRFVHARCSGSPADCLAPCLELGANPLAS